MSDPLRSKLIRLAHANPDIRPLLLPLLKEASDRCDVGTPLQREDQEV